MINYLVIDIENNNSPETQYGRGAGNFLYDKIVAISYKNKDFLFADYYKDKEFIYPKINSDIKLLVGHNIKHDLLFLWNITRLQNLLKEGLKIWDTQLVEYILTGQRHKYPALRDIAINKYNCPEREKLCESYWNKGIQTSEIPRELVLKDVQNDVLDTESVFLKQYELVIERNLLPLIQGQMDFLLATIEIEYNGMKIDRKIFRENKQKLEILLEQKKKEFLELIKPYWRIQNENQKTRF